MTSAGSAYGPSSGRRQAGLSYGETDEFGYQAVVDRVHVHDLNATILHLLGFNHEKLTYFFQGRNYRLTDVSGHVVQALRTGVPEELVTVVKGL